ncbi:hypothetical protein PGT21_029005 [Puccinia graminis f. sp. tritici]|uniref:Uncharacterized protein n=1 Tax=Puccinia graminis f. sp. tritici TaxID=56615 RepID=A0A5B0QUD6_PUCGR|nr:hypothetical protein PGT21_029005 [Puccinia graminis f. sp. tritici]KAA1116908.1 hypothetical protein PGTUg99_029825 [Puccinia graminis f. sp. tritici]
MNLTTNLIAALLLVVFIEGRGGPGTDPNKAFACTLNPQCPTGLCIAKTGSNTYAVRKAHEENLFSCVNEPIGNSAATGTLCCPPNFVGEDQQKTTNGNILFTTCVAPDP